MKLIELKVKLIKKVIEKLKIKFVFFYFLNLWFQGFNLTNNRNDKYILLLENTLYFIYMFCLYIYILFSIYDSTMNIGLWYD